MVRAKKPKLNDLKSSLEKTAFFPESGNGRLKNVFVGAHVSAASGLENAFGNARNIGANCFALFLKNQRKWVSPPLRDADIENFRSTIQASGIKPEHIVPHGSYLINLGNPDTEKWKKSLDTFIDDLKRAHVLGLTLYNIHPGSTVGMCDPLRSIELISEAINIGIKEVPGVVILLETMAGQGNVIGSKFNEIRAIIDRIKDPNRIGVCLDTCHIFSAGYDIRTKAAYDRTMGEFENVIGFNFLKAVHVNDSKEEFHSKKDRHETVGKGKIGLDGFRFLMNDARFQGIPLILETPEAEDPKRSVEKYAQEIFLLTSLCDGLDTKRE